MVREHLDRMNVGIAIHDTPGDSASRIRCGLGCGANAGHNPAQQPKIRQNPKHEREQKAQVRLPQQHSGSDQIGNRKSDRIEKLKNHFARRRRCLHDPVRDTPGKIILKPADRLTQNVLMRPPPHQSAKVRQDTVVQQHDLRHMDRWTQCQNENRNQNKL